MLYFFVMDKILPVMETVLDRFQAQHMELEITMAVLDQELVSLGVSTIGNHIHLREACKRKIKEPSIKLLEPSVSCSSRTVGNF